MIAHTLQKEKHQDFLKQERIDPITGDILQEGDNIVICASCKSAFLVDSWEYIDRTHCEQTDTLKEIPKQKNVKISWETRNKKLDSLSSFDFNTVSEDEVSAIYLRFFALIGGSIAVLIIYFTHIGYVFIFVFLSYFFFGAFNKITYTQKSLCLSKGYFIVNKESQYRIKINYKAIKTIKATKVKLLSRLANSILFKQKKDFYDFIITTKTGEVHKVLISESEVKRINIETNFLRKYTELYQGQSIPLVIPVRYI
ncbi:hypothetical protein WAF17_20590 [Bernardetia sp. ABR2-2B]|uniref:hypothetical protein n=1 Tax=Bernardetia sp. ABR2-2B TaxID=3127472 RepID=UPI0030D00A8F